MEVLAFQTVNLMNLPLPNMLNAKFASLVTFAIIVMIQLLHGFALNVRMALILEGQKDAYHAIKDAKLVEDQRIMTALHVSLDMNSTMEDVRRYAEMDQITESINAMMEILLMAMGKLRYLNILDVLINV